MSEIEQQFEENEVHYVYSDQEYQELILGQEEINPELRDLRAILVDGQYIVTDSQAIVLQESDSNLTQFYINDNSEGFVVNGEDTSANTLFENSECVQSIEEDTSDGQQVIYYTNEENGEEYTQEQEIDDQEGVEGIQDEDGNIYPFKRIKLEGQMLNLEEFLQEQTNLDGNNDCVKYTIVEEHSQSESCADEEPENQDKGDNTIDFSKITGRNLITGQTVTLHSYMEKLKKRLTKTNHVRKSAKKTYDESKVKSLEKKDETKKPELCDLLDRKISIGKTKSGKKIVGKIIHVERKNEQREEENQLMIDNEHDSSDRNEEVKNDDQTKILVKKSTVSIESFDHISKTLGGVMEMESVRKKLENKNIVVKLVEKKYNSETDSFVKNTSYSYGYMEQEISGIGDEIFEKWKFVPDQDTQDVLLGDHFSHETLETKTTKFPITTSLTILITYEKAGNKTIRVNLNPAPGNLCTICAQYFKSNLQLRQHMNQVHNTYGNNTTCEVCDETFDDLQKLQDHREIHVQDGKLFLCFKCNKSFPTQTKLQKHLPTHDLYFKPLECSVCQARCACEWSLKKHLLTHTGFKPFSCAMCNKRFLTLYDMNFHKKIHFPEKHFACNICMRTFSRHSNLLRHTEIHKGTGALYKCDICYCSYNYISSLTRHMVQNHIEAGDFRTKLETDEN